MNVLVPGVDDPAGTPHRPGSRAGTPGRQDAGEVRAIHQTVPVEIAEETSDELITLVWVMVGCLVVYLLVLLLPSMPSWGSFGYATLGRREGWLLFFAYLAAVGAHIYATLFLLR